MSEVQETNFNNEVVKEEKKGKCVCKTIAWIVVILAIAGIYVLHFMQPQVGVKSMPAQVNGESKALIITVNTDSIMEHFELVKVLKKDLEDETKKYQNELQAKSSAFETKYQNYAINVQNQVLTQTQMQNTERQLLSEKQTLEALSEKYTTIMMNKELSVQNEVTDSIKNATKRINDAYYNASYVFAVSSMSAILYANDAYDVTDEVIKVLNESYKKSIK